MSFSTAQSAKAIQQMPFDYVCRALIDTGLITSYYDLVLIDEGQDFPDGMSFVFI
jgi:superfamily I DNA and RNA helicase